MIFFAVKYNQPQLVKVQNPFRNGLTRDFEYLYNGMYFSDLELEVEGKTIKAHKAILTSK
jgi:hypothetical protein